MSFVAGKDGSGGSAARAWERALTALLAEEVDASPRMAEVLNALGEEPGAAALAAFLRAKESEDRARMAFADRERWHRRLSWRLVRGVMLFGVASAVVFGLWGGERAFEASLFFVAGGAAFYFVAQAVVLWRVKGDALALRDVERRTAAEIDALRAQLGGG